MAYNLVQAVPEMVFKFISGSCKMCLIFNDPPGNKTLAPSPRSFEETTVLFSIKPELVCVLCELTYMVYVLLVSTLKKTRRSANSIFWRHLPKISYGTLKTRFSEIDKLLVFETS